ncbi:hypothetical protein [Pseudomonas sediminis]|uniref:hypothetical protein n=1 Tax=Pseudomonas sediminis TaxID=1691904 RepID=UPI0031CC3A4E
MADSLAVFLYSGNGRAKRGSQANTSRHQELAGNAMILKRISQGNHANGAELDGRF